MQVFYNGSVYRSELEARWAYFFDELKIRFDYGGRWFELPEQKSWLQVLDEEPSGSELEAAAKRAREYGMYWNVQLYVGPPPAEAAKAVAAYYHQPATRIYLAGSMSDWRDTLLGSEPLLDGDLPDEEWPLRDFDRWPFLYVGPYRVACGHGCYTFPDSHGVVPEGGTWCGDLTEEAVAEKLAKAYGLNNDALESADVVFAWINEARDCYATFAEIGYAAALEKRVIVAASWLAGLHYICEYGGEIEAPTPAEAFAEVAPLLVKEVEQVPLMVGAGWGVSDAQFCTAAKAAAAATFEAVPDPFADRTTVAPAVRSDGVRPVNSREWRRIEADFGRPMREVLVGLIACDLTRTDMAERLRINPNTLDRYMLACDLVTGQAARDRWTGEPLRLSTSAQEQVKRIIENN